MIILYYGRIARLQQTEQNLKGVNECIIKCVVKYMFSNQNVPWLGYFSETWYNFLINGWLSST